MKTSQRIVCWIGLACAALAQMAAAQTIESFSWVEGSDATVARITFNANVRFLRQAPAATTATDLAQLSFQLISAEEAVLGQTTEEGKRLAAQGAGPRIDISYTPVPKAQTKLLTLRVGEKVLMQVRQGPGSRLIDLVVRPGNGADMAPAEALPEPVSRPQDRHFVLLLQSVEPGQTGPMPRIPAAFQNYDVYTQDSVHDGARRVDLLMGYFKSQGDAEQVRRRAQAQFPLAQVVTLAVAPPQDSAQAPAPVPTQATAPAPVEPQGADVDGQGAALLAQAQAAYAAGRYQEAIVATNKALMLPPNPSTPAAQELIGVTWEALGQPDKARSEYQLYARLYPQGEALARVEQRLAALGQAAARPVASTGLQPDKKRLSATGSVSQYYYGGQTKTDSLVNIATGIDQNTLTRTNQSVLVSSWDATGRYETDDSITKLVMRGSHSDNLASASSLSSTTQGLVSAAYVDYRDIKSRTDVRVGRQSAIGGSLFGLFDGVSMARPVGEHYKFDAMLGVPANTLVNAPQQSMAGAVLEADNLFDHWGGSVSVVEQTTESISDRRAIGAELRYFGETVSMFSQVDYDVNFNTVNALTLQGSFQAPFDTTVTMLVDDRKAPSLQLSDALISSGSTSLGSLLDRLNPTLNDPLRATLQCSPSMSALDCAQRSALATAAQAKQAMLSLSRALSPKWQGSVDFHYSEVGALPAVGNFQAQPATGAQYNVSFQLTGSNLYSSRDISGFSISQVSSDSLNGIQFGYNNLTGFMGDRFSLEPSIRFYTQTDNTQTRINRVSPGLRVSYKLSERANLMAEGIYESSQTEGPTNHESSESYFFYLGYRYDFQ